MLNEPQRTQSPWQMVMGLNQYVQQLQCQVNDQQALINRLCKQLEDLNERMNAAENKPYYHVDTIQYHFDQLKVEKLSGTLNIGMSAPSDEQIKEIGQLVTPGNGGNGFSNGGNGVGNGGNGVANGGNNGNGSTGVVNEPKPAMEPDMDPQATNSPHQFPAPSALGIPPAVSPPAPYPEIRHVIDCYLDQNAPQQLQQIEAEAGVALDPFHRRLVIEDIRKQMSQRIQFYIQTALRESKSDKSPGNEAAHTGPGFQDEVIRKTERDIDAALYNYVNRLLANP